MAAIAYPRTLQHRSALPVQAVYRRRRAVALLVVVTLAFVALLAAVQLTRASTSPRPISTQTVVVHPGDTLWSIAERLPHHGDVRSLVDELEAVHGPGPLQPGEQLAVPG
jgi:LysM repeat protein